MGMRDFGLKYGHNGINEHTTIVEPKHPPKFGHRVGQRHLGGDVGIPGTVKQTGIF
jgi:hypothetical protein